MPSTKNDSEIAAREGGDAELFPGGNFEVGIHDKRYTHSKGQDGEDKSKTLDD